MRVICHSINEFLMDLTHHIDAGGHVLQNCIRMSIFKRKESEVKEMVVIQLSAVVLLDTGGEYLLEVGCDCGIDYNDSSNEKGGTEACNRERKKIEDFCKDEKLTIRPGVIGI